MRALGKALLWLLAVCGLMSLLVIAGGVYAVLTFGPSDPKLPERAVLHLDLNRSVSERQAPDLFGRSLSGPTTFDIVRALERAAADDRVAGVVAELGSVPISMGKAQEIADAVLDFRATGKFSVVFSEDLGAMWNGTVDYLAASAFEEIWLQPTGGVGLSGIAIEMPFLRGALDKLEITPEFEQRHEYKGGADMFTLTGLRPEVRQSLEALLGDWVDQAGSMLERGRGISPGAVRTLMDNGPYLAEAARDVGLVDRLGYREEVESELAERLGGEPGFVDAKTYLLASGAETDDFTATVAVVYGVGSILPDGGDRDNLFGPREFAPYAVADALHEAREDPRIDAVLFRVVSPGGAYGPSDVVWRAVMRLREAGKPVVAVMGDIAASGGYFVAAGADRIIARPGAVTGSIGVYSGKFATEGLWSRLGVAWDRVEVGRNAGLWSNIRPLSESERAKFSENVDFVYRDFTAKVAKSRGLDGAAIERAAGGRIWSGASAIEAGLIDELGGFREGLAAVRSMLGLHPEAPLRLVERPEPEDPLDKVLELLRDGAPLLQIADELVDRAVMRAAGERASALFSGLPMERTGMVLTPPFRLAR